MNILESSIPERYGKEFASGDILMFDSHARCRTIEDVNWVLANPKDPDCFDHTIRKFIEPEEGVYTCNPEWKEAPFGIFWMSHKDGHKWIVGIKMNYESVD